MELRRTHSKKRRLTGAIGTYLKFKAISKFAKGARKGVKGLAAYKTTKSVAKRAPDARQGAAGGRDRRRGRCGGGAQAPPAGGVHAGRMSCGRAVSARRGR